MGILLRSSLSKGTNLLQKHGRVVVDVQHGYGDRGGASDADAGANATLTYALSRPSPAFSVDPRTGGCSLT